MISTAVCLACYTGRLKYATPTASGGSLAMALDGLVDSQPECSFAAQYLLSHFDEQGIATPE